MPPGLFCMVGMCCRQHSKSPGCCGLPPKHRPLGSCALVAASSITERLVDGNRTVLKRRSRMYWSQGRGAALRQLLLFCMRGHKQRGAYARHALLARCHALMTGIKAQPQQSTSG